MNNRPTILVVDDDINLAQQYAKIIGDGCGFTVISTSSPEQAKEYALIYPIRVAVLDQIMPVKGTELFKELQRINSKIKPLIITGEASFSDAVEATELGIIDLIKKSTPTSEPIINKIFYLNLKYEQEMLNEKIKRESIVIKRHYSKGVFRKKFIEMALVGYEIIDEMHVKNDSWIPYKSISVGEKQKVRKEISIENSLTISNSNSVSQMLSLSMGEKLLKTITLDLQKTLESSIGITTFSKKITSLTVESEIVLSDNSLAENGRILERSFECAQIYKEVRVFIDEYCSCCDRHSFTSFVVCLPTDSFFRRIKEVTEKGSNIIESSVCTIDLL